MATAGRFPARSSEGTPHEELDHPQPGGRHADASDGHGPGRTGSATPRAELKAAATAVAYEQVGGPNYAEKKADYPTSLNWGNDGCSVPPAVANAVPRMEWVLDHYMGVFEHSCDRHDFGYRNFGKNTTTPGVHPKFSPTEATKSKIDTRFLDNMRIQCDARYDDILDIPANKLCRGAANIFYAAVKYGGHGAFFG